MALAWDSKDEVASIVRSAILDYDRAIMEKVKGTGMDKCEVEAMINEAQGETRAFASKEVQRYVEERLDTHVSFFHRHESSEMAPGAYRVGQSVLDLDTFVTVALKSPLTSARYCTDDKLGYWMPDANGVCHMPAIQGSHK